MKRPITGAIATLPAFLAMSMPVSAELLFFDNFNYSATNETIIDGQDNPFVRAGGWNGMKSIETGSYSENGSLTTVTKSQFNTRSGTESPWPGNSDYALRMVHEGSQQSDFYLQLGDGNSADFIPANVYFQFWIYLNRHGSEVTAVNSRNKFLYPTNTTYGSNSNKWLFTLIPNAAMTTCPNNDFNCAPGGNPTDGRAYFVDRDGTDRFGTYHVKRFSEYSSDVWNNIGANLGNSQDRHIKPNVWTLVRIHYDTSNNSSGIFEVWLREYGGPWRKVAEWIGGQSPNANFIWRGFNDDGHGGNGGHRRLRMPTTWGPQPAGMGQFFYLRDFAMASSADSLPTYEDEAAAPLPPTDIGIE